ncbi:MAG TPA: XRE family transcriptional regulator [Microbacterium sp.]|uniref:helix-turn-helix transcriptional regulator n=1 Tax=unclassified Microbacterium TaxID=2609290 RepID=UPI000C350FD8|nr:MULTISPECIES: helix-turn-helix transcriptional regulator [unclassified Microbacterium]MBU18803.1 transcriptional regulator [Microbacterium sp.]HBS09591.1 XRE family transcriptional regulator [Microbacterium sp.]|tara:strand:+ start:5502 stop:5732 length:231 start_codon:yes stop_codon:yes gene_type:complete
MAVSTADPDLSRLPANMKRLRAERGLTYEQLAEASGLSRRGVISLERAERMGTVATWVRIARALGVSASEFFSVLD